MAARGRGGLEEGAAAAGEVLLEEDVAAEGLAAVGAGEGLTPSLR